MNVLIVEDDQIVRKALVKSLRAASPRIKTYEATGLPSAKIMFARYRIDLVLLDLHLPPSSVETTLNAIPEFAETSSVIVVTGFPAEETKQEARKQGALGFVEKTPQLFKDKLGVIIALINTIRTWNQPVIRLLENLEILEDLVTLKIKHDHLR